LQLDKFHFTLTSFLRYQQARPAGPTNAIYTTLSAFISREICGLGHYYLCFGKERVEVGGISSTPGSFPEQGG
jgi:hypothetical protein